MIKASLASRVAVGVPAILLLGLSLCPLCSLSKPPAGELTSTPPSLTDHLEVSLNETYYDPEGFFSIQHPGAWNPHKSGSEMQFWVDDQGDATVAISLQIKATSADGLLDDVSDLLTSRLENYQEFDRLDETLSGYPAVLIEQAYDWNDVSQRGFMVGCVRNRIGYLVLAHAPTDQYPDLEPTFRAIGDSLNVTQFEESPPYDEWLTHKSPSLTFHYLPETFVADEIETIAMEHEEVFKYNTQWLEENYHGSIDFYLYPSKESLYRATARDAGFAINPAREVHALWVSREDHQSLGHEMTHVITHWTIGEPSEALLGEGIAVCMDHAVPHPHDRAAALVESGQLLPLSQILGNDWFEHDPAVVYPESGSLVCWLLQQYSVDQFKQLYTREDFPAALEEIYGFDINRLEEEWRAGLGGY
jgi:hypothetical protein